MASDPQGASQDLHRPGRSLLELRAPATPGGSRRCSAGVALRALPGHRCCFPLEALINRVNLFFLIGGECLPCCVGFCRTTTGIRCLYACVPSLLSALPLLLPPLWVITSAELSSCASRQLPPAVLPMVVCTGQCHALSSPPLLPLLCPQVRSLHLHLYFCR